MARRTTDPTEVWSIAVNAIERWTRDRVEALDARRSAELARLDGAATILAEYEERLAEARRALDLAREEAAREREARIRGALDDRGAALRTVEQRHRDRDAEARTKHEARLEAARETLERETRAARARGVNPAEQRARRVARQKYDRAVATARRALATALRGHRAEMQRGLTAAQRAQSTAIARAWRDEERSVEKAERAYRRAAEKAERRREDRLAEIDGAAGIQAAYDEKLEAVGDERTRRLEAAHADLRRALRGKA